MSVMKKNAKWFTFLVCSLCVLLSFPMNGFRLVQGSPPREAPHVVSKTVQYGVPSASFEWEASQLVEVGETFGFTGTSPVPFTGLVVGWLVDDHTADPRDFEITIRTRANEESWTEWVRGTGDIGPTESPSGLFWSHLYTPSDSGVHTNFQIRVRPPVGMLLTLVRIEVFDNSVVPEVSAEVNASDPVMATAAPTAIGASVGQPDIIPRLRWLGAEHPWNVSQINITHAIVHHTVNSNIPRTEAASSQLMRDIRAGHIRQGWSDIGYNFVIDGEGRVFQGRHNPWLNTTDVLGAHAGVSNSSSVGIALIGQFQPGEPHPTPTVGHPSVAARQSLERVLAWRLHQRALDPLGSASIRVRIVVGENPDRTPIVRTEDRPLPRIIGHRDVSRTTFVGGITVPERWATACPGDNLYNLLPAIRTSVRSLFPPQLRLSPTNIVSSLPGGSTWTHIGAINVTNPGGGTLSWTAMSSVVWLSVSPGSGTTTAETDAVSVRATTAGLNWGTHTGTITFTPSTGTPSTVTVTLSITALATLVSPSTTHDFSTHH